MEGTPKTLSQAILNGIKHADGRPVEAIHRHVQDYLAQVFAAAMLKSGSKEEESQMQDLFLKITQKGGVIE